MFSLNNISKLRSLQKLSSISTRGAFFSTQNNSLSLPVLKAMLENFTEFDPEPLKNTAVIYIHHPLKTSVDLLTSILSLGLSPKNTFVLGKHYSENTEVVETIKKLGVYYQPCSKQIGLGSFSRSFTYDIHYLWAHALSELKEKNNIENLLILDHGGYAINSIPAEAIDRYKVVGMEKTSGGLMNLSRQEAMPFFPLINVANCAAKRAFESPLIAEAVLKKLSPVIPLSEKITRCGVIGYGAIGQALSQKLFSLGHQVIVYDKNPAQLETVPQQKNFLSTSDLRGLVFNSDLVFGCSGQDVTESIEPFRLSSNDKLLISCSSEDREFLTLLHHIQKNNSKQSTVDPLADITYKSGFGSEIKIMRGGFPYNFDQSGESVPAQDIQLTRALVLAGVFQAISFFKRPTPLNPGLYSLDAGMQKFIVKEWLKYQPHNRYAQELINKASDIDWVNQKSSGIKVELDFSLEPAHETAKPR